MQPFQSGKGGAREHPIGGNIGEDEGLDAKGLHLLGEVHIVQAAAFHPTSGLDLPVQGVTAHSDAITVDPDGFLYEIRVGDCRRADDHAPDAHGVHCLQVLHTPDAAAHLDPHAGLFGDLLHDGGIHPTAALGTVQVHHVDDLGAGSGERLRHGYRVIGHLVDGVKIALFQAHNLSVFQINGRFQDHLVSPPKFFKICIPTSPDFSGWNWVPNTLPLWTAASTSPP